MDNDQDFDALLEQSSLGTPAARRLRTRTPVERTRVIRRIIELRNTIMHSGGTTAAAASQELEKLVHSLGERSHGRPPGPPALRSAGRTRKRAADAVADLAVLSMRAGDLDDAEQMLDSAAAASLTGPGYTVALLMLAQLRLRASDPVGAERALRTLAAQTNTPGDALERELRSLAHLVHSQHPPSENT
ncbi:tetratricopeptide repeat protein [Kitasatospora sp. NPDC056446]|uniref:tetratricopeptide repeat protein n=1 Tax=Kitasatospora sp. NPDC056446 TaxID=3345819 RepID=UPI0036AE25D6